MSLTSEISPATETPPPNEGVRLRGVTKSFPGVRALSTVDFDCSPGEVHALVGENGSGKSTLIKIASGVLEADAGTVTISGRLLAGGGVKRARQFGLATAYQDTSLVADLSVADNITLSLNAIGMKRPSDLDATLARFGLPFKQSDVVSSLGPGARQLLEVARSMITNPRVLMLDEPTAALDLRLAAQLEGLVKEARDSGMAIVYVSHRLAEVRRLADRLTVLRDGVVQGTFGSQSWEVEEIVELMVGAPTDLEFPQRTSPPGDSVRLDVRELRGQGFGPVSLTVHAGEIVGLAGAEGNGQRALLRGILGIGRHGGGVSVDGKAVRHVTPGRALAAGIGFQSGDRAAESIFAPMSVMDNATAQLGSQAGPAGTSLLSKLLPAFKTATKDLGIVSGSPFQPVSALSGGNQQKAVLARPALRQPKVLIVDEPTQGVDARARLDIYRVLSDSAEDGLGVLVNSSDSAELVGLCDRVYVMSRGVVVTELTGPSTENEVVKSFVSATDATEAQETAVSRGGWLGRLWDRGTTHLPIAILLLLITVVGLYAHSRSDVFWTTFNLSNLLLLTLPLAFVALGQQFNMVARLFDLSIGSVMSLTVVVVSMTLPSLAFESVLSTALALVGVVLAVGGFNSVLIVALKVPAIVATVASMGIVQGVAILLRPEPAGVIAPEFVTGVANGISYVPFAFIALVVLTVAMEYWLYRRSRGLALRAVGYDGEAALRVGERVTVIQTGALMICTLGAVIGGVFLASQTGMGSNAVGAGYTLPCFAAVFLGGAVLTGGRGSFIGALLGALFLALLDNVTPLLNIADAWRQIMYGVILLVAIAAYASLARIRGGAGR
ncbi:ribose transport system ATP-binding protein [Kribbella sp. VKM Ac-2527]|uniref:Ribose transport system ATP-binding protein n=1 Tax=Kribbella caucasensis TaxID=2512215 RepID=A0A4R6KKG9_9ACTN|nr:ribose transport system ATP-binding protein [Kribbella sp. VKM Ac-2527]